MTSYVTREEYDRLAAKVEALERLSPVEVSITVCDQRGNVFVQNEDGSVRYLTQDERIAELVKEGVSAGFSEWRKTQDRGGFGAAQQRYARVRG